MTHLAFLQSEIAEFAAWRQDLHANPELAFAEERTADIVVAKLRSWGYSVETGVGHTGVVATLSAGAGGPAIGLRADMDALPILERNAFPHASRHSGVMHACGHDGHTSMLLAAARRLARTLNFRGTVRLIFQPAEESGGGAKAMLDAGLFERFPVAAVFAMHNAPGLPAGMFAMNPGAMAAASDTFQISISGRGGHAAFPHLALNPLIAAAELTQDLAALSMTTPAEGVAPIVTVTTFHGGEAINVVPQSCTLAGAVRSFDAASRAAIEHAIFAAVERLDERRGVVSAVTFERGCSPCINSAEEAEFAKQVAEDLVGEANVIWGFPPQAFSEDFAFMLERTPGAYVLIGNGDGPSRPMVHSPDYDFNDEILPLGAAFWANLVERALPPER